MHSHGRRWDRNSFRNMEGDLSESSNSAVMEVVAVDHPGELLKDFGKRGVASGNSRAELYLLVLMD